MKTDPNYPANPTEVSYNDCGEMIDTQTSNSSGISRGLTKREHFASIAMQGLLANPNGGMQENNATTYVPELISKLALLHADALITALNK